MRSTFFIAVLLLAGPAWADEVKPVIDGPEGRRAFDDLAGAYKNRSGLFDDHSVLANLRKGDAVARRQAGEYLLALFAQSFADESNGRCAWEPTPFTNEGPDNRAHEFRTTIAADFSKSTAAREALPAALWLIENDPVADDAEAGATVLARIHSDAANDAIATIIREVHPNQLVLVTAINEAVARHLTTSRGDIAALEQSYRKAVRGAAVHAAARLGETNPVPYDPLKAFSPRVTALLKLTLERNLTPVPSDATWLDGVAQPDWNPGKPYPVHGWQISQGDKSVTYLDVFGQVHTVTADRVRFTPGSLARTAHDYADLRAGISDEALRLQEIETTSAWTDSKSPNWKRAHEEHQRVDQDMDDRLKEMTTGMHYIGPPGGHFLNLPEMNVAAWCWQRGDLASAAAVLFPCYDAARDDRWLDWSSRDDIGNQYDLELLQKFTVERDYPTARKIAAHMGGAAFDGYVYQGRSRELAAQLDRRTEDFVTLKLPNVEEWTKTKAGLSRAQQIAWLASRLKLMHCINPDYDEVQFASAYPGDNAPPGAPEVINPFTELLNLNLTPSDLVELAPYAADADYMPSYRFYKDFIPWRGLCRVSGAVGALINSVAGHDIVHETDDGLAFEHGTVATLETDLKAWIAVHHDDTPDKLVAQTLRTSNDLNEIKEAAIQALKIHHVEVLETLAARITSWPMNPRNAQSEAFWLGDMVHLLYGSHAPMAGHAREWIKSPYPDVRLWAALILVRDGDAAHDEGFAVLEPLLNGPDAVDRYIQAAPVLLASPSPQARRLAAAFFSRLNPHINTGNDLQLNWLFQLYFIDGRKECLDYLLKALDDYAIDPNTHNVSGDPVYCTASLAFWLGTWGRGLIQSPRTAAQHLQYRAKLKEFLVTQFALVEQGKPTVVHATIRDPYEQFLVPEPPRRHTALEAACTQD